MRNYIFYSVICGVLLSVIFFKNSHLFSSGYSSTLNDSLDNLQLDKTSKNRDQAHNSEKKHLAAEWLKVSSVPDAAKSFLLEKSKIYELDILISDIGNGEILSFLAAQSQIINDDFNQSIYYTLQKNALVKDPKLVVENMKELNLPYLSHDLLGEAIASFALADEGSFINFFTTECEFYDYSSGGYPCLKKLRESGLTYTESIEILSKYNPKMSILLLEDFFRESSQSHIREDQSMLMTRTEKNELTDYLKMNFRDYDLSSSFTAIEQMKEKH